MKKSKGTQRIVSVNYLFGGPLIPSDFLTIIISNFRDMRNLLPCSRIIKKVLGTKKKSGIYFGEAIRLNKVFGKWIKSPLKFESTQVAQE